VKLEDKETYVKGKKPFYSQMPELSDLSRRLAGI
jgi:hypothetical protein